MVLTTKNVLQREEGTSF